MVLGLAVWLVGVSAVPALAQEVISASDFDNRLDRAQTLAAEGASDPSPQLLESIERTLDLPVVVQVEDRAWSVEQVPLLENSDGEKRQDFRDLVLQLQALAALSTDAQTYTPLDRAVIEPALVEAYRGIDTSGPNLLERLQARAQEILASLVEGFIRVLGRAEGGRVVPIVVLVGASLALFYFAWRMGRRLGLVPEASRAVTAEGQTRPVDMKHEAELALRRGDLRMAIRYLYRALLQALAANGLVADDPSLTAGECRRAIRRSRSELYSVVDCASSIFEKVIYGNLFPNDRDIAVLQEAVSAAQPR